MRRFCVFSIPPYNSLRVLTLGAVLLNASGCGSGDGRLQVYPVNGAVRVAGQAADGAKVIFNPVNPAHRGPGMPLPTGTTGPDGKFTLNSYARGDGAPAGEYQVAIIWPEAVKGDPNLPESPPMRDRLNDRYSGPETSGLTATVNEGPTELPPFELP